MRDWREWYADYDDPGTTLARRLVVVRRRVAESLAALASGEPIRILSLCSGDGRDLLPELAGLNRDSYRAVLVEKTESIASDASNTSRDLGLTNVEVINGDAGMSATFADRLPVDLLLLCGIFGNISEHDVRTTVSAVPSMLTEGGTVIWTRGSHEPDLRQAIREWFAQAGLDETSWDSETNGYGVGVARQGSGNAPAPEMPERLFSFIR